MRSGAAKAVHTATCQLLLALAQLDADAVWLLLFRMHSQVRYDALVCIILRAIQILAVVFRVIMALSMSNKLMCFDVQSQMQGSRQLANPCPAVLPDLWEIFPQPRAKLGSQAGGDASALQALLRQVEQTAPAWHQKVQMQEAVA